MDWGTPAALMLNRLLILLLLALAPGVGAAAPTPTLTTVKIAFVDPLSGPFAANGQNILRHFQLAAEEVNRKAMAGASVRFEIVPFDNKGSPQESLTALRAITDARIHYLAQGSGSHVAIPLSEAIARHNARDPAAAIVYLDYAAVDPDLTNGKCNFWHFRFDANTDMRMEALTDFMRGQPQIHKVYLVNQNYSHGQQVARAAKEMLARKRPDIRIAGEDLHPMGQVRDFAPYIAKIRAAGADAVITGNWGTDLSLLVRAARDAGLAVDFYTYYAGAIGAPTAIGAAGADRVHQVTYWHPNIAGYPGEDMYAKFKRRYNEEWFTVTAYTSLAMLATAMRQVNSTDPLKVAYALEGLKFAGVTGEVEMRALDHQLQQPLYISVFTRTGGTVKHDAEGTGYGFRAEKMIPAYVAATPTSCQMQRPARP